jgi:serine/threonine protein kinase
VVRQYVRGVPLNRLRERLTRDQAVAVAIQLCGVLRYLHEQTPPVIHRDIKPQNIILSDDGLATLIDFGISRYYDKNARSDTVCFGTQEFAPPEQYGFSQTDCRADIFSLGVLLGWMLTGQTSDFVIPDKRSRTS